MSQNMNRRNFIKRTSIISLALGSFPKSFPLEYKDDIATTTRINKKTNDVLPAGIYKVRCTDCKELITPKGTPCLIVSWKVLDSNINNIIPQYFSYTPYGLRDFRLLLFKLNVPMVHDSFNLDDLLGKTTEVAVIRSSFNDEQWNTARTIRS